MSGKRKWSAARALYAYTRERPIQGDDQEAALKHLVRAYLAGIEAAIGRLQRSRSWAAEACESLIDGLIETETARLNKRASKRGKGRA